MRPGITAKISQITDLPEEAASKKFSTAAAVPLAKKQSAVIEITVAKDVPPDVYRFRVQTPLGTSNMVPLAIGSLPEVKKSEIGHGAITTGGAARNHGGHDCRARRQ